MAPRSTKTAPLGLEDARWAAANQLRTNRDAVEYKQVVLGLLFLKYVPDSSECHRAKLETLFQDDRATTPCPPPPPDRWSWTTANECTAPGVFRVSQGLRRSGSRKGGEAGRHRPRLDPLAGPIDIFSAMTSPSRRRRARSYLRVLPKERSGVHEVASASTRVCPGSAWAPSASETGALACRHGQAQRRADVH